MDRVLKVPGNRFTAARVAGQDAVFPHLALDALDMKLSLSGLFIHWDNLLILYGMILFYHIYLPFDKAEDASLDRPLAVQVLQDVFIARTNVFSNSSIQTRVCIYCTK